MAKDLRVEVELFGSLFVFMQQLTRSVDEGLEPFGLTSRQWLLLAVIEKAFDGRSPTISEAAAIYGTSRQNVKQIALQLERRGWLRLEPDQVDARAVRLVLTERIRVFHDPAVQAEQAAFILAVFRGLDKSERRLLQDLVVRCSTELSTPPQSGDGPTARRDLR